MSKNRLLDALRPEARAYLTEHSTTRPLSAGEVVYDDGDEVTHAVFPCDGVVAVLAEMHDGRSVHQVSVGCEGFIGYTIVLGGGRALGRSVVLVEGSAIWTPIAVLDTALERFDCVRKAMLRYGQAHTMELMQLVACNSLHTAEQRLCRWLLRTCDRVDAETFYLTQDAMAKALGLRRATVNMICGDLMNAGGLDYRRGNVSVTDRSVLEKRTCECYARIRLAYDQHRGA